MHATLPKLSLLVLATTQLARTLAMPASRRSTCTEPSIRVEWNTLTEDQKAAYFAAELCLLEAPAKTGIPSVVSRYDDFVGTHAQQSDIPDGNDFWHVTGQSVVLHYSPYTMLTQTIFQRFLHVHRYFVHVHETILRTECGYTGPLPYWNEVVDAGNFSASPVLLDFGGNGDEENDWAVIDGPFANLTLHLGIGTTNTEHLLTRQTYVDALLAQDTFSGFKTTAAVLTTQSGVHPAGHLGIGGDMADYVTSPNDPMFWMHHAYLDYGNETQKEPPTGYVETTGDTVIYIFDILPDVTVADVLDTQNGLLCYTYAT
ncbi:tyrosinase [Desarmillaria tabescens]|uniref:Tyrosinase n=1 Tax=Armillaria tabescens TaxID=1929756 RepID=A0AA39MI04_ARMTA|nr:tyrosinase [Desarmillaria tabescens]KAK0435571.1 tyrosinase [Desarmillaria tabescens]